MAAITKQRDLVSTLKKETILNVGILSKLHLMPLELSRAIFKENALEKLTQNLFYQLSYYLVCIIDSQVAMSFSWPLYDTKKERAYRLELAKFINDYSNKGLLTPVMSSYFVNPVCFKVTKLIFQLSQLAVQKLLLSKMVKNSQKKLFTDMTDKYKSQEIGFFEQIEQETHTMMSKFSNYMNKRKAMEKIAKAFCNKITEMEAKLISTNAQTFLNNIVDTYLNQHTVDNVTKQELLKIKNVNQESQFFEAWLLQLDCNIDELESKWSEKITPLIQICQECQTCTSSLIARHTGEADQDSYMIQYNHKTDEICTLDLQKQVNSQQAYILKNLVKDEKLNFPNLIRGFFIAVNFILKDVKIDDDIYKFNEYFDEGKRSYKDVVIAMGHLVDRIINTEAKLEPPVTYHQSILIKDFPVIPPLPDISDLYFTRDLQRRVLFDTFTPLNTSKHQFNLRRKTSVPTFVKPQSNFVTPFFQATKENFMKSLISCHVSSYDHQNTTQNFNNISMISNSNKVNETIAECSTGFTKHQILRLLSTKKTSSSKKYKYKTDRPDINIKKGGLFNESNSSNESTVLFRSHSSPNLFENREKRPIAQVRNRRLSIMPEDSATLLEVSGIAVLDRDSSCDAPKGNLTGFTKSDSGCLPSVRLTQPSTDQESFENNFNSDLNQAISSDSSLKLLSKEEEMKVETPTNNVLPIRKTSSLEKIINRFKTVRASVLPRNDKEKCSDFRSIAEEKDNININVNVFTANHVLLPDLLSPSCSVISTNKKSDYTNKICADMGEKVFRKPRESLGTALGVDETFLDQFDLID